MYLAAKYEKLYNKSSDEYELIQMEKQLNKLIDSNSLNIIDKITWESVKACSGRLKTSKNDPTFNITTDCFKGAPDCLHKVITLLFKSYVSHGHVSKFLLLSTLIPVIKNKLGDHTSSENYRSIAISSVVLEVFDLLILSLFQDQLHLDLEQ